MGGCEKVLLNGKIVYQRTVFDGYLVNAGSPTQESGGFSSGIKIDVDVSGSQHGTLQKSASTYNKEAFQTNGYSSIQALVKIDIAGFSYSHPTESFLISTHFTAYAELVDADNDNVLGKCNFYNNYGGSVTNTSYNPYNYPSYIHTNHTATFDLTGFQGKNVKIRFSINMASLGMVYCYGALTINSIKLN